MASLSGETVFADVVILSDFIMKCWPPRGGWWLTEACSSSVHIKDLAKPTGKAGGGQTYKLIYLHLFIYVHYNFMIFNNNE